MGDAPAESGFLRAQFDRCMETWIALVPIGSRSATATARLVTGLVRQAGMWSRLVERAAAADAAGDADATMVMAWVCFEAGDESGFLAAVERAAERGQVSAARWKERRYQAEGRVREAERWAERARQAQRAEQVAEREAAERGDPAGMYRTAEQLLVEADQLATQLRDSPWEERAGWDQLRRRQFEVENRAHELLVAAAEAGNADAAYRAGRLLDEVPEQALPWYRRADELGHPEAACRLGASLYSDGEAEAGEAALRRAESRGSPEAASLSGAMLRRRDPARAEAAYRRAAAIGYLDHAWADLAHFLEDRGDLAGAEAAWRDGTAAGEHRAEWKRGVFHSQHPEYRPNP